MYRVNVFLLNLTFYGLKPKARSKVSFEISYLLLFAIKTSIFTCSMQAKAIEFLLIKTNLGFSELPQLTFIVF